MRNLIRKILKEDDFDWIREIKLSLEPNKIYYFIPPLDIEEMGVLNDKIQGAEKTIGYAKRNANSILTSGNHHEDERDNPDLLFIGTNSKGITNMWQNTIKPFPDDQEFDENWDDWYNGLNNLDHIDELVGEYYDYTYEDYVDGRKAFDIKKGINESDEWGWVRNIEEHPNYEGHPQGVVWLYSHQDIDRFCDVIDEYNGIDYYNQVRDDLHRGFENRRDELEQMSAEDNEDYGDAIMSGSFFVEKRAPHKLSIGYWGLDVYPDDIEYWLDMETTFNKDYKLYENVSQVEQLFKSYKNPNKK